MACSNSKKKKINVLIVQNFGKVKGIHSILSEVCTSLMWLISFIFLLELP